MIHATFWDNYLYIITILLKDNAFCTGTIGKLDLKFSCTNVIICVCIVVYTHCYWIAFICRFISKLYLCAVYRGVVVQRVCRSSMGVYSRRNSIYLVQISKTNGEKKKTRNKIMYPFELRTRACRSVIKFRCEVFAISAHPVIIA